jgi:FADH2 O2-dependent halogenase
MLPLAAGFVDPLLSTGFALSLLGIERLAHAFTHSLEPDLTQYESDTLADLDHTLEMVAALYRVMPRFDRFQQVLRLYFIAVIFTETVRRLGRPSPGFLLRDHPRFSPVARACLAALRAPDPDSAWPQVEHGIQQLTEEFDLAGFDQPPAPHWHGCDAAQLHRLAHKIPATRDQIDDLLHRTSFNSDHPI